MGWLDVVKMKAGTILNRIPPKWKEAARAVAESKRLGRAATHATRGVGVLMRNPALSIAADLVKAGVFPKTPLGLAKAGGATLGGMAAVAAPIIAAKGVTAMGGAAGVAQALRRAATSRVGQGVARGVKHEATLELRRRVRPPRRRRAPTAAGAAAQATRKAIRGARKPRRKSTKPPSAKQLAARRRFAEMARSRRRKP